MYWHVSNDALQEMKMQIKHFFFQNYNIAENLLIVYMI